MAREQDASAPVAAFAKHPLTGKFSLWIWPAVLHSVAEVGLPPPGSGGNAVVVPYWVPPRGGGQSLPTL